MNNYNMLLVAIIIFILLFSIIIIYNKNNIAILNIIIIIIILFNIYYWFFYRKMILNRCEKFNTEATLLSPCNPEDNCIYTVEQLKKSGNNELQYHNKFIYNTLANDYTNFTDVRNSDPLLAYSCINKSPNNIILSLLNNNNISYKYNKLYNLDENSLNKHIEDVLKEIKNTIKSNIKGPIYVIISQSPYLRYRGSIITARFDTTNNKYSYYNEIVENGNILSSFDKNKSLYMEVLIIFPSYNTIKNSDNSLSYKLALTNNISTFINFINTNKSNSDLCFLKCNNGFNLTCGCLNTTKENNRGITNSSSGPEGNNGYDAKCHSEKNEQTDYSMLYFLNPYNPIFKDYII